MNKYSFKIHSPQYITFDIRKLKQIHPRTLNRYLQELTLFHYVQIVGGNKYKGGYSYKITNLNETNGTKNNIEHSLNQTIELIKLEHCKTVSQNPKTNTQPTENKHKTSKTTTNKNLSLTTNN